MAVSDRKTLERILYNATLQDMEISLFSSKLEIVKEIRKLTDTELLNAIFECYE